jgi:hypothetical protein
MATTTDPSTLVEHVEIDAQSAPEQENHVYAIRPELIYERNSLSPLWLSEYKLWFVNRREYYVQNAYALPADYEKAGGYVRVQNSLLTEDHIARHLCGIHTIGLYTIEPETNSCKWFCLDADYKDEETGEDTATRDLGAIAERMRLDGLSPAYENSRRGGHLWLLCDEPLPAKSGRIYLYNLLDELGYKIRGRGGNKEGVEIFPKQEVLEDGQVGNGVRAPMGIHRKVKERFWFRDAAPDLASQFAYLRVLPKLTRAKLDLLIGGMTMPEDMLPPKPPPPVIYDPADKFTGFDIRRYVSITKTITQAGVMIQCPSCASQGRDRSRNNLHVSSKPGKLTPVVFCHAGCTFRDIQAACGFRYERQERKFQRKFN